MAVNIHSYSSIYEDDFAEESNGFRAKEIVEVYENFGNDERLQSRSILQDENENNENNQSIIYQDDFAENSMLILPGVVALENSDYHDDFERSTISREENSKDINIVEIAGHLGDGLASIDNAAQSEKGDLNSVLMHPSQSQASYANDFEQAASVSPADSSNIENLLQAKEFIAETEIATTGDEQINRESESEQALANPSTEPKHSYSPTHELAPEAILLDKQENEQEEGQEASKASEGEIERNSHSIAKEENNCDALELVQNNNENEMQSQEQPHVHLSLSRSLSQHEHQNSNEEHTQSPESVDHQQQQVEVQQVEVQQVEVQQIEVQQIEEEEQQQQQQDLYESGDQLLQPPQDQPQPMQLQPSLSQEEYHLSSASVVQLETQETKCEEEENNKEREEGAARTEDKILSMESESLPAHLATVGDKDTDDSASEQQKEEQLPAVSITPPSSGIAVITDVDNDKDIVALYSEDFSSANLPQSTQQSPRTPLREEKDGGVADRAESKAEILRAVSTDFAETVVSSGLRAVSPVSRPPSASNTAHAAKSLSEIEDTGKSMSQAKTEPKKAEKISLATLERYVPPPASAAASSSTGMSKKASMLRNIVNGSRPTDRPPSGPRPRPASASATANATATTTTGDKKKATNNNNNNTFLTGVDIESEREAHKEDSKSKFLNRFRSPLRFHVKKECMVLTEICPHKKSFESCTSFLCVTARESYEWWDTIREKAAVARQLVQSGDQLLRSKLEEALEKTIEARMEEQEIELMELKQRLCAMSNNHKMFLETKKYFDKLDVKNKRDEELYYETGGMTGAHYQYVERQLEIRKLQRFAHSKRALDYRKYEYKKEIDHMRKSIETPMKYLDGIRDGHLVVIDQFDQKVERAATYILQLTVAPQSGVMPSDDDILLQRRLVKQTAHFTDLYRTALTMYAKICKEIRHVYCNAESQVQLLMSEGKISTKANQSPTQARDKVRASTAAKRKTVINPTNNIISPTKGGGKVQHRPHTAPQPRRQEEERTQRQTQSQRDFYSSFNNGSHDDRDGDFEALPVQPSRSRVEYDEDFEGGDSLTGASRGDEVEEGDESFIRSVHSPSIQDEGNDVDLEEGDDDHADEMKTIESAQASTVASIQEKQSSSVFAAVDRQSGFSDAEAGTEGQQVPPPAKRKKRSKSAGMERTKGLKPIKVQKEDLLLARANLSKHGAAMLLEDLLAETAHNQVDAVRKRREKGTKRKKKEAEGSSKERARTVTAEEVLEPWCPFPCVACQKRFRGEGKTLPKLYGDDSRIRQKAKTTINRIDSLIHNFERKVTLGLDYSHLQEDLVSRLQQPHSGRFVTTIPGPRPSTPHARPGSPEFAGTAGTTRAMSTAAAGMMTGEVQTQPMFCSYECVKRWALSFCPMQHKYHNELLIDMAAGYSVKV